MNLIRQRDGKEIDRLTLDPLFKGDWDQPGENLGTILRKWEPKQSAPLTRMILVTYRQFTRARRRKL